MAFQSARNSLFERMCCRVINHNQNVYYVALHNTENSRSVCLYEQQDLFEARNVTHKAGQEQERYTTTDDEEGFGSSSPVWSGRQVRGFGFVG